MRDKPSVAWGRSELVQTFPTPYRIREEEAALTAALGERYRAYCRRTWRLLPGVY